jgi:hypothetical protein
VVDRRDEIPPPPREVTSDRRVDEQKVVEEKETPAPKLPPKEIAPPSTASSSTSSRKEVPVATRSGKPGRVKSPFPPYAELDITGLNSGSLAKDPGTGQIFRVP